MNEREVIDLEGKTVCTVYPDERAVEINNGGYITKVRFTQDGCRVMIVENNIMPVARVADIDTGLERIALAFSRNGRWRTEIFDKSVVSSAARITQTADHGIMVTSENARYLVQYLNEIEALNEDKIEIKQCISRCGWIKEYGFVPYCEAVM